jgi:isoleucyl-tRNA synthetase
MSDFREELRVGKQILARVVEAYRKFRNTLRYLTSNLYDFDPAMHRVAPAALSESLGVLLLFDRFANRCHPGERELPECAKKLLR